jgi:hypothetical protein
LARVVEDSATINHAQLVGKEKGEVIVKQYNWASFLKPYFKRQAFEGIKSLHHLVFSSSTPGQALVRKTCDGDVETVNILNKTHLQWKPTPNTLPEEIIPPKLSPERQRYLYEKIREFVPEESRDKVCPNPDATPTLSHSPHPPTQPSLPSASSHSQSQSPSPNSSPLPKRQRCGH